MITSSEFKAILKDPWQHKLRKRIDQMMSDFKAEYPDYILFVTITQSNGKIHLEIEYDSGKPIFSIMYKLMLKELELELSLGESDTYVNYDIRHTEQNRSTLSLIFNHL